MRLAKAALVAAVLFAAACNDYAVQFTVLRVGADDSGHHFVATTDGRVYQAEQGNVWLALQVGHTYSVKVDPSCWDGVPCMDAGTLREVKS